MDVFDIFVSFFFYRYLKGAQIGEEILVKAHTDRVAKKLAFLSVQIINKETGDLIALGSHTKYLL